MTYCDGLAGLHGWQWMFIAEGVPTILLGFFGTVRISVCEA
jgi:hypothetical protein